MKLTRLGMRSTYSEHVGTTKARYWMRSSFTWTGQKVKELLIQYRPIELISRPLTSSNIPLQPLHPVFGTGAWSLGTVELEFEG